MALNESEYFTRDTPKQTTEILNLLTNQFPRIDVWVFAIYPNQLTDPLNFNKRGGRFVPITKAEATLTNNYNNGESLKFQCYNKKDSLIKKTISFSKHYMNHLEIFLSEDEAYQAYEERVGQMRKYLSAHIRDEQNRFDEFGDKMMKGLV